MHGSTIKIIARTYVSFNTDKMGDACGKNSGKENE